MQNEYYRDGKIIDPELGDCNILHILKSLFEMDTELLCETLVEIGGTCIQGLSHRLLLLYIALIT